MRFYDLEKEEMQRSHKIIRGERWSLTDLVNRRLANFKGQVKPYNNLFPKEAQKYRLLKQNVQ
jgi:hypothetical protein